MPDDDPTPGRGESGRDRLRAALLHPRRNQVVVAVLLAVVGFAAVVQVRTNDIDDSYSTLREQDLIDVLSGLAGTSQRARSEIDRLEQNKRDLQSDARRLGAALAQAQQQADTLNILAGLVRSPARASGSRSPSRPVPSTSTRCSTRWRSCGRPAPRRCSSTARCA